MVPSPGIVSTSSGGVSSLEPPGEIGQPHRRPIKIGLPKEGIGLNKIG